MHDISHAQSVQNYKLHFFSADGYCKYHTGTIQYGFTCKLTCCNKGTAQTAADLLQYQGCAKGKHRSKHHIEFFYTNYLIFMKGFVSCLGQDLIRKEMRCTLVVIRNAFVVEEGGGDKVHWTVTGCAVSAELDPCTL